MPIHSVRERNMQLPRIGTIRKGIKANVMKEGKPKKVNGRFVTYPKEVPYLVFNIDPNDTKTAAQLMKVYGPEQQRFSIDVYLPFPDAMQAWDFWLEAYVHSQMVARSDGAIITFLRDIETGQVLVRNGAVFEYSDKPNSTAGRIVKDIPIGEAVPYIEGMAVAGSGEKAITFKASGRLQVILPALRRLATFTVMTGALFFDIPKIDSTILMVDAISKSKGIPANTIPLVLRRFPMEISVPGKDGTRQRVTKHMLELEIGEEFAAPLLESFQRIPLLTFQPDTKETENGHQMLELESGNLLDEDYDIEPEVEEETRDEENFSPRGEIQKFWQHVRDNRIENDLALQIVKESKNDFDKAYKALLENTLPK
jgi:hypothetical protein